MQPHREYIRHLALSEWNQARQRAFWARLNAQLRGQPNSLLDFNAIVKRLRLQTHTYRGLKPIPVSRIVGSAGRYQDFTRAFLPKNQRLAARWLDIAQIFLNPNGRSLPAIEVYQIGQWYFVRDGNHRVSVAKQIGIPEIDAHVWEYVGELPPTDPGDAPEAWLLECERQNFLRLTELPRLRPDYDLRLSEPGGYAYLLEMISGYQEALYCIDDERMSYPDAVGMWYDMLYEGAVQLIQETGVLRLFPKRTAADLFVWIMQHHEELDAQYGHTVMVDDAARAFQFENSRSLWARLRRWLWLRR